jgi:benzoyl-CoA 2,3-dioxygenase component B
LSTVVNDERIPNNVNLSGDPRLMRALEQWQPNFLSWWRDMGPEGFQAKDVYLRTAISVTTDGWAHYDFVQMPEYRWGIFLADPIVDRRIGFGDHIGQPVWQDVPGEHRNSLRRLIVTQADTEPASVEQQRLLGKSCPSLYDLRNLFQVNVEEGRHLWAMVYLLHGYFGRDGREEAEELLARRSGSADRPRILGAFNEPITDWLSFYMFTMFTDRDGKYQLLALSESGFDPLSRTTRFMLTEEAHHMFVGETGVGRVVQRSAELTRQSKNGDARELGGIDLPTLQKYLNLWYSLSLDLFGSEVSTNAANFFGAGLKGRAKEEKFEDHSAIEGVRTMEVMENGRLATKEIPLRNAMNEVLRDGYVDDCQRGVDRWNKAIESAGLSERLVLPSRRFHRAQGVFSGMHFDPVGQPVTQDEWDRRKDDWLPSASDRAYVKGLQASPVSKPGEMANWIAAPPKGINGQPLDFVYVRTDDDAAAIRPALQLT